MSAAIKATTILGGLAVAGAATAFTLRQPQDFCANALAAAEHGAPQTTASALKPKLPSTFFEFTLGNYKVSNARA